MWIEDLPNGKYKFSERYSDEKTGRQRKVSTTLTTNSPQAKNKALRILNKKIADKLNQNTNTSYTLTEMFDKYYDFKSKRWANATKISAKSTFNNHIDPYDIKDYLLDKITIKDMQELIDIVQYDKNLSKRSAMGVKNLFVAIINHANKFYQYDIRIDAALFEYKDKKQPSFKNFIEPHLIKTELESIRKYLNPLEADITEFQILTGMRFGEAAAITKDDWDKGNNTIRVNKSVDTTDKNKIKSTKNTGSYRTIDSSDRINEILSGRIEINDVLFGGESCYVFATRNNTPLYINNVSLKLKSVNPKYSTHTMRHTHISLLIDKKFDLKYIMDRVGHVDSSTTLNIYTHLTLNQKKEGAEKLNNLF